MNLRFEELPAYVTEPISETIAIEQLAAERRRLWAVVLNLVPKQDGDMWCVLWGENLHDGIAGFGASPEAAMCAFEDEMQKSAKP